MTWQDEAARADEMIAQLPALGPIDVVRMFSGVSLQIDGVPFAFLIDGSLYLRVDDVNRPAFERAGMRPFSYANRTREVVVASYYEAPADLLEDPSELHRWCHDAYRAAIVARKPRITKSRAARTSRTSPRPRGSR